MIYISLDNLYEDWVKYCMIITMQYIKLKTKKRDCIYPTFGEYHTWNLREGRFKII